MYTMVTGKTAPLPLEEPCIPVSQQVDEDFSVELNPDSDNSRTIKLSTMKNIIDMIDSGKKEKSIKAKYRWYERKHQNRFRKIVHHRGTLKDKFKRIDKYVFDKFYIARNEERLFVHENNFREWGWEKAVELGIEDIFKATPKWLHNFKIRHNIVSRKITKKISRSEQQQKEMRERSIESFHENYPQMTSRFEPSHILNSDQVPFNYEITGLRTLSLQGERDTYEHIDSHGKSTHSYTAQPVISRDGRLIGKLLLVMKEPRDEYGDIVGARV